MKDEWTKGVQWGAMVWLVWLSASLVFHSTLETAKYGAFLPHLLPTIAWSAALALTWTRWSRSGVALAIAVQIISGAFLADIPVNYQYCKIDDGPVRSYLDLQPLLSAFMPQILPAIPLLFLVPDRPRLTMALALVGRWRDAGRSLAGWRWVLVAAGVALLARSGLEGLDWWNFNEDGVPYFRAGAIGVAFAPQVVLFALAELPRLRWPARSTVG
jgi:hypothetical protein